MMDHAPLVLEFVVIVSILKSFIQYVSNKKSFNHI